MALNAEVPTCAIRGLSGEAAIRLVGHHRRELSWFATGGAFEHDATGRSQSEMETFTQNVWTAPMTPGPVYLWTVLRDDRGGIDFAPAEIDVTL